MDLRELLLKQISEDQTSIINALAFNPVKSMEEYSRLTGEIKGLQRVIKFLEDLPDE